MASSLSIVRMITLLLMGIYMVSLLTNFYIAFGVYYMDSKMMNLFLAQFTVLLIGCYGSYANKSTYLTGFAIILILADIVGFVSISLPSLEYSILVAIMSLAQSVLIRRGF